MMHTPLLHDSEPALSPFIETKCRQMAGRFAAVVFLLTFFGLYVYGIATYGFFLGIGLGWLPSGLVAWFLAIFTKSIADSSFSRAVMKQRYNEDMLQSFLHDS